MGMKNVYSYAQIILNQKKDYPHGTILAVIMLISSK